MDHHVDVGSHRAGYFETAIIMTKFSLILGMGQTGLSTARYLRKHQEPFKVCDTRPQPPHWALWQEEFPEISYYCGDFPLVELLAARQILISPGLSLHHPAIAAAREKGIPILGDIELFAQAAQAPIVGITGTNAKGTVTTLVGNMASTAGLKVEVGGNIGTTALSLLERPTPDLYVLELSSFQLETTYSLRAIAATILNLSEDHLDHHRDMTEYLQAKQRIYQGARQAVFSREDVATYPLIPTGQLWSFGLDSPQEENAFGLMTFEKQLCLAKGNEPWLAASEVLIPGRHNLLNALAALALCTAIGLPKTPLLEALKSFKGLPHRCELVHHEKGIRWYNDSKATNLGAVQAALKGFADDPHQKLILIAGGDGKNADFSLLRKDIADYVDHVILFGKDAQLIAAAWKDAAILHFVPDLQTAVLQAAALAEPRDIVLLSPACSSLDMFKNFEDRGEQFCRYLKNLTDISHHLI